MFVSVVYAFGPGSTDGVGTFQGSFPGWVFGLVPGSAGAVVGSGAVVGAGAGAGIVITSLLFFILKILTHHYKTESTYDNRSPHYHSENFVYRRRKPIITFH